MLVQEKVDSKPVLNRSFSAAEAQEILNSVVKQYRNLYNLQYMKQWERNHEFDSSELDDKVESLSLLQNEINAMIREARETGAEVDVEGLLKLNFR